MDCIVGLPNTQNNFDSIMVVVDRLTKIADFKPTVTTVTAYRIAELFMREILNTITFRMKLLVIEIVSLCVNFGLHYSNCV